MAWVLLTLALPSWESETIADDEYHCYSVMFGAYCSTSYAQSYINAISKCGDKAVSNINEIESLCRKNEHGQFCGELLVYISSNCTDGDICTAACFNALRLAGCCASVPYKSSLMICNIPMPTPCSQSNLRLPDIAQGDSCSSEKYDEISF